MEALLRGQGIEAGTNPFHLYRDAILKLETPRS
jgi:hypothetical protein